MSTTNPSLQQLRNSPSLEAGLEKWQGSIVPGLKKQLKLNRTTSPANDALLDKTPFAPPPFDLFDPLLALLRVEVPRRAETPLVLGHIGSNDSVLACLGIVLVVTLHGVWSGVETGPVDLGNKLVAAWQRSRTGRLT